MGVDAVRENMRLGLQWRGGVGGGKGGGNGEWDGRGGGCGEDGFRF
jgi:hypothetical protein